MSFPKVPTVLRDIFRFRKTFFVIFVPLVALPLALKGGTDSNGEDITQVRRIVIPINLTAGSRFTKLLQTNSQDFRNLEDVNKDS
jgi:hypothetical protein